MPTYVYRCQNCDVRREAFQKMTDDPLTTCEECGGVVRRVLQPVGIVFKGPGFYVTDYKRAESGSSKSADSGSADSSSNGKSADSGSSKSEGGETKPASEKAEKKEPAKPVAAASS